MSCRRIRRELLWLVRFGEFDAESAPHLDHLAGCQGCRDDVGLDRALVRQLRTALAERIGEATPSPSAWEGVLARMRQPEPVQRPWTMRLASFLRAGSAMAGASLALIVALNLEVAPIGSTPSPAADLEAVTAGVPVRAGAGIRHWEGRAPAAGNGIDRQDVTSVVWVPTPSEQLPLGRSTLAAVFEDAEVTAPIVAPNPDADRADQSVVLRLVPIDAAAIAGSGSKSSDATSTDGPSAPAIPPVGGPS